MGKKYRPMFGKRKTHKFRNTMIILLILVIALLGFVAYAEVFAGMRKDNTAVSVYLPADATENEIVQILAESDVIKYPLVFKVCSVFGGKDYISGSHILTKDMTYFKIFSTVKTKQRGSIITIVINDGATINDVALVVSDEFQVPKSEFLDALNNYEYETGTERTDKKLEGYLAPGLYNFKKGTPMSEVVAEFVSQFDQQFGEEKTSRAAQMGYTVDQIITIASLVEKQAQSEEEKVTVAKDILNKLQSDAPLNSEYALMYSLNKKELVETDKKIDTPYNTFVRAGLPKGPICSPSVSSIEAVLK